MAPQGMTLGNQPYFNGSARCDPWETGEDVGSERRVPLARRQLTTVELAINL